MIVSSRPTGLYIKILYILKVCIKEGGGGGTGKRGGGRRQTKNLLEFTLTSHRLLYKPEKVVVSECEHKKI